MSKINVLEKQMAELIAAGEVVERPASIVKELVENSIDAGAGSITVEIKGGGISYIRVTDNGSGIEREDVSKAFLRHATSKVRVQEDLSGIATMGFRGEALASIAAMCRVELLTRTKEELAGTHYVAAGGEQVELEDAGCPAGSTIIVRDVFYNTPARMKFLKRDVSEGNSVAAVVEKAALGNPDISFRFLRDGAEKLRTPGDGRLLTAVRCVLGKEFAGGSIPVEYTYEGLQLSGLICRPEIARGSRTLQNFFLNGRFVRSKTCMAALEEGYRNALMVGRFPSCVLNLTVPYQAVDVNVHPAKTEVRFADEKSIFNLVYYGCKTALGQNCLAPELRSEDRSYNPFASRLSQRAPEQQSFPMKTEGKNVPPAAPDVRPSISVNEYKALLAHEMRREQQSGGRQVSAPAPACETRAQPPHSMLRWSPGSAAPAAGWNRREESAAAPPPKGAPERYAANGAASAKEAAAQGLLNSVFPPAEETPASPAGLYENARLVGEAFETYLILENGDELLLVDKHAAHERLLFNRLKDQGIGEERQLLLTPVTVQLSPEEYSIVLENIPLLSQAGLTVEDFGENFVLIREVAPLLADADLSGMLLEFIEKLRRGGGQLMAGRLEELFHTIACRSAVKARDKLSAPSQEQLVKLLKEDGDVSHCPHGRPVAVRLTRHELEKRFGRLG